MRVKKFDSDAVSGPSKDGALRHGRKITLNLQAISLGLPEDDELERVAEGDSERSSSIPPEERAHLDAWNADRVERASLPPAAAQSISVHPSSPPESEQVSELSDSALGALELAGRKSQPTPMLDLVSEMAERFALGDFSGCLRASELLLGQDETHSLAIHYARESRQKLEGLYISRLTALGRIPQLVVKESEIRWLGLDSRMGFLLSRIDGISDCETLLELSGMPRMEALRCLIELVESKIVRIV